MHKAVAGLGALVLGIAAITAPAAAKKSGAAPSASQGKPASARHSAESKGKNSQSSGSAKSSGHHSKNAAEKHASGRNKGARSSKGHPEKAAHSHTKAQTASRARPVLQALGGPAGLLAGWPFTRPGSPGRFEGRATEHRAGGFVGWFGPVFWPYAYDDLFAYAFWPIDSFDDGEAFWAFAYDELFTGVFWANAEPEARAEQANIVPTAAEDLPDAEDRSRAGVLGFEGQSREFAQICGDRTPGLSQWPILRIAQSVGLSREQRSGLKELQTAAGQAAQILKAACPAERPATPVERLEAMQERLEAMLQAVDIVRPAVNRFYDPLSDPQKARFQAVRSSPRTDAEVAAATGGENDPIPQICTDHPDGLSVQTVDRLESVVVRVTETQRTALEALRTASAAAATILHAACPPGTAGSPPERLAIIEQRLRAMLDAANLLRPALQSFYDNLTDAQKTRFNAIGKQALR